MNTTNRTLTFIAVASIAVLSAVSVKYFNRPVVNADFADVGQEFFTEFSDPLKATSLSVAKFDADAKEPMAFSVKQDDKGLWVIPSHHDYPAEAADRLAKTAASFIGAKKLALQSRSKDDWGRYGVADPEDDVSVDPGAKEDEKDESRGTRVTLRDSGGNALVDLIIGKPVEGQSQRFYVRQPEKNNVYIAEISADLSAKFSDWIEPDLLKLNQSDIVQVVVDKYSVDEDQGEILPGETLEFDKDITSNKWTLTGLDATAESLKEAGINDLARNLDQLKIVGVRPKPEGLNSDLTVSAEMAGNPVIMQILQADMQRQGFFIARGENGKKKLVSNEGELVTGTKNGVRYTLYFGEVARGSAKDIETGLNEKAVAEVAAATPAADEKTKESAAETGDHPPKPETQPADAESGPRRYLLVKVEFDEALMGKKPTEPVAPEKPAILNETAAPADVPAETKVETPTTDAAPDPESLPKEEAPKEEAPKDEAPKEEAPKEEAPKEEAPKEEAPKEEAPKEEAPKEEAPKEEAPKEEAPKEEAPKEEAPKEEAPKEEAPKEETPASGEEPQVNRRATENECIVDESVVGERTSVDPATQEPVVTIEAAPSDEPQPAAPAPNVDNETPEIVPAKPETPGVEGPEPAASQSESVSPANNEALKPTDSSTAPEQTPPVDAKAEAQKKYLQALGQYESEKDGFADALKAWEERGKEGQKLAKELSTRFGAWYYVISADSFEKLRPSRTDVVGPKETAKTGDTSNPPSFDGLPGNIPEIGE